jgi:putative tricarboxylic transport membrane protein
MEAFFGPLLGGLELLLDPQLWVLIGIGTMFGVVVGALPGLATTLAYGLVLPFTFALDAVSAVALLLSVTVGVSYGNSIPAILLGVPGTPAAVLTVLDGYSLHRKGETGLALGLAYIAAAVGQTVSVLFFIAAVVPLASLAFYFLNPEIFALYLFGIVAIVSLTGRNLLKGLLAAAIGLLVGMVGLDPVNFVARFDFGERILRSGLSLPVVVIGILAVSELFRQARQSFQWEAGGAVSARFPSWSKIRPTLPAMFVGTIVGTLVGAIPGAGGTPAALISYQQAQLISKDPKAFGKGAPDGVAANEAAQNSANSGELIPTLGLGIPGSGSMVLLLAALTIHGFLGGPGLVRDAPQLLSAAVAGMLGGTLLLLITGWPIARLMLKVLTINRSLVIVLSLATVVVGIYSIQYRIFDVVVCFVFGAIGYFMLRYGYSTAAAALAVVLAMGMESGLRRGLSLFENDIGTFATRPITAFILLFAALFFAIGLRRAIRADREARAEERQLNEGAA